MSKKMSFVVTAVFSLAALTMACSLTSLASPKPTALFASPTSAPTLALIGGTETAVPPSETAVVPTETTAPAVSTSTTATPTPPPTVAVTRMRPSATHAPSTAVPTAGGNMTLKIFLIAINDGGAAGPQIGCNDSVVGVNVQVPRTQGVLRAALAKLLSLKSKDYGMSGLYNALYQSNLAIDSLAIQNGEAIIRLTGNLVSGGVCDDPRIIAQIEQTALQFSTVQKVSIFVNGVKIQDLLSGRGG